VALDPGIWLHYIHGEKGENIQNLFIPCLSCLFRVLLDRNAIWLQAMPTVAGSAWALWYFWTKRSQWDWLQHGPILLLVSVMVAPYAWFTDEALALPAMLFGLYRVIDSNRSPLPIELLAGVALFEVIIGVPLPSPYYLWTMPAWLACYLYSLPRRLRTGVSSLGAARITAPEMR
jgi:hypothetical protein